MYPPTSVLDAYVDERAGPTSPLLRRQRGLPLPRPRVRRPALRAGGRAGRGVAADRVGGRGLRALAAPVACVRKAGPVRPPAADRVGRRARRDERLLLRGDRPP